MGDEDRVVAELENHRHENMLGVKDMAAQGKAVSLWMRRGKKTSGPRIHSPSQVVP